MFKRDLPIIGFIIGAIMPLLGFFVVFLILRNGSSLGSFVNFISVNKKALALVISLSCLANIIPFIYFNSKRMSYTSRGVFLATMLYALWMFLVKFVW